MSHESGHVIINLVKQPISHGSKWTVGHVLLASHVLIGLVGLFGGLSL